ncbi:unnamed protein product [Calypogeia fissa]
MPPVATNDISATKKEPEENKVKSRNVTIKDDLNKETKAKSRSFTTKEDFNKAAKLDELQEKLDRLQSMLDGLEEEMNERAREDAGIAPNMDPVCNSCLVRKKGAALVPCGHTFCWKCTSDLRRGKGPCPSCNCNFWNALSVSEVP